MREGSNSLTLVGSAFRIKEALVFAFKIELKEHILEKLGHNNDMF